MQAGAQASPGVVQKISWGDIAAALGAGIGDFFKAPVYGAFFGAIFALGGLFIVGALVYFQAPWMILPVMIGFPLIGPFAATGIYEVSRRLEAGEPLSWRAILVTVFRQRERQMGWMAFVVLFIFWIWIYQIRILLALFLGFNTPSSVEGFVTVVLTTGNGMMFLAVGTLIGAILALFLFSATVIAMPLLLDTERDFVTAMITSFKVVSHNPWPMLGWGVVVTLLSLLAMAPAFLGLLVVMPVLGHATWHLYRRALSNGEVM